MSEKFSHIIYLITSFLLFNWQLLSAQESSIDSLTAGYMTSASRHAVIFSGKVEQPLGFATTNHPYFKDLDFVTGRLSYCGVVYPDIRIRWDLYRDEFIILSPGKYNVALNNENIDFVEIYGYYIFPLWADGLAGCPPAGNYILLYSGNFTVIEKLTNTLNRIESASRNRDNHYFFRLSSKFYLLKDEAYQAIKNKRMLLKALGSHRKELKSFMRTNDLRFKGNAETTVLEVVKEHERLSRP
jgi:hypothetical protein